MDAEAQALADALAATERGSVFIRDQDVNLSAMGRQDYTFAQMRKAKWPVYRELWPNNTDIKIERGRLNVQCIGHPNDPDTGLRYTWLV